MKQLFLLAILALAFGCKNDTKSEAELPKKVNDKAGTEEHTSGFSNTKNAYF